MVAKVTAEAVRLPGKSRGVIPFVRRFFGSNSAGKEDTPPDPPGDHSGLPVFTGEFPDGTNRHRLELWRIDSNPRFEIRILRVPNGTSISQVVIDTNSVLTPEPSGLALSGTGLVCLVGYGWRRARRRPPTPPSAP